MNISKFYENEYANSALYQSFRAIASVVDGFKPSARKVFYTVDKKNITSEYKVANLAADVSSYTEYIHGADSLSGVIVGMAQSFNNNYPLLAAEGSFGNRLNRSAAASRYIFTKKSPIFDKFFNEDDKQIIEYREFEGKSIEPYYYVPIVPLLLLNGSSGIGNGYAQKILPRKLEDITNAIDNILAGKKVEKITPWFNGFRGTVSQLEGGKVEIRGTIINEGTTIKITEIPFGYELNWYLNELDKFVEKGIIKDYKDLSEEDTFSFEVKCTREFSKQSEHEILDQLKLIDRQSENFTSVSENDSIIEFKDEIELLKYYIEIRKKFYIERKVYLLTKYENDSIILRNKIKFIESIMNGSLIIFKKKKQEIEDSLQKMGINSISGSYEYLHEMRVDSFTEEKLTKLKSQLEEKVKAIDEVNTMSEVQMWKKDISTL